tara:strand:+ start:2189 stop:2317 length:129 start_codon:yes stop_codon:yes gene_type:complete
MRVFSVLELIITPRPNADKGDEGNHNAGDYGNYALNIICWRF